MATMQVKRVFKATPNIYSSLKNFLPAGTLTFNIIPPLNSFTGDNDPIAEDEWRSFPQVVVGFRDETGGIDSISFLVRHRFIAATYFVDAAHTQLHVRVYVIPWDLAGSRGELRERDEDIVLKGSKYLKQLFVRIRTDRSLWEGSSASSSSPGFFVSPAPDNRSLMDIYNTLTSPSATPTKGRIPGLRTKLYNYQRRSVATMIERETNPGTIEHPLYVPMKGMDGRVFYMQPATMEILSELPRVSAVRGGILCEELGTGKTVMVLSLILGTLDQLAAPEEGIHEERTPLTNVAFRCFQTAPVLSERAKFSGGKKRKESVDSGFPSLAEIILHKIRVAPEGIPWREPEEQDRLDRHRMWKPLMANVPFYLHTPDPPEAAYGRRGRQETSGPKVMYLTSATIVIVPDNLRRQWANEILKHCTDLLRVLLVEDNRELPDAPVLATYYDVGFSQEAKKKNVEGLHSWKVCECKLLRRCKCSRRKDVSPLLQIRWKRLVVDEGHNTAEKRTEYAIFSNLMSVERRWIVTGTPTTNLLGLSFGAGSELLYPDDEEETMQVEQQRLWHGDERDDLRKLGNMLSHFLLMMPFASKSEPKAFTTLVANPLFAPNGPYPGDIDVLVQVMSSVMVRHRIEDVEAEVTLALLDHKTVLLDLDPMAVKTYNLIQATIAVNAVDSERMHQDYLFHPRNTAHLQALVANISNVMFWHVVDSGLDERLTNSQQALENLNKRNGALEDFELIEQSINHVRSAMDDPVWLALQNQYHIFRAVDKMHPSIYAAWSGFPELAQKTSPVMLLSPAALAELRKSVTQRPLSSIHQISENGRTYIEKEQAYQEYLRLQDRKKKSTREKAPESDRKTRSFESEVRKKQQEKKDEMKREMDAALARLNAAFSGEEGASGTPPRDAANRTVQSAMLRLSPVAGVRIRNSTSTKLDYILHEVLTYGAEDKFLIFSESAATLSFIAESFDLCRIKYLSFSGQHDREERQSMITTFETSDLYRVLLLELKYGARGLNLVSASRVIFCEPVWKADVESQAIKRVHRIGQTRTIVHVTTLAIKSTFEEVMVARSKALRENKQEFAKAATDDRTIRDFIENPVFLPVPTEPRLVDIDRPQPVIEITSGPPRKKAKVSFAD
ncbi:P-loop containing nucleoside triphosphate hydrolase protein [Lenzites betulinus]|nr:P-loop containing nucleoside triphosphate hydrolase protein [Lenzites betulinus]